MDRLIKEDDEFILLKLATGETLVATMRAEDDQTISIEYPFELKTIDGEIKSNYIIKNKRRYGLLLSLIHI